jgi:hypothetical protein
MAFTQNQWIILGSVILVIPATVGITLGVVVGRKHSGSKSGKDRVHDILLQNPLIDG